LQHPYLDHQHHGDLHNGPGKDLIGLDQVGSLPQAVADAARGAERLGDQPDAPAKTECKTRAGKKVGQNRRQLMSDIGSLPHVRLAQK
jgi:hypothetical protein